MSNDQEILQARARKLARPLQTHEEGTGGIEVLEFRLAHERYAVESRWVQEVQPLADLTPLPGVPPFLRGIVNLRGRILPVIDLKRFFDLPEKGLTDLHSIVVVRGEGVEVGILVDLVTGMRRVSPEDLQTSLPTLTGIRADYLRGVTADRLVVLELARVLSDRRILIDDEVPN